MECSDEQLLHWVRVGEGWIGAITGANYSSLARWVNPEVHCRLVTPRRIYEVDGIESLIEKIRGWFQDVTSFHLLQTQIQPVGERLGISYRLLIEEKGRFYQVAQQVFTSFSDGAIMQLDLLCSGFQPVPEQKSVQKAGSTAQSSQAVRSADQILIFDTPAEAVGSTCALLTPAIREKMRGLASGQVLEVIVDDRSARGDIEAWSRLSGNALLTMEEDPKGKLSFLLKKK